jgi:GAF domain-containing protein
MAADGDALVAGMAATLGRQLTRAQLLNTIVEAAAAVVEAEGAALLLIDEERGDLWFEAALQASGEDVRKFRVPLGHGIAGLVAVSGQPMAISQAQDDPRHASDIAEQIGHAPRNLVCVPLHAGDDVIGVLECLDKRDGDSFRPRDIEVLGQFANVAAAALAFSAIGERVTGLITQDAEPPATGGSSNLAARRAVDLAARLHSVAVRGPRELELVEAMVEALATYLEGGERQWEPHAR